MPDFDILNLDLAAFGIAGLSLAGVLAASAIGAVGGFTRGVSGFGAALVMVPAIALLLPTPTAVAVVMLATALTNVPLVWNARRHVDLRTVAFVWAGALAGLPIGIEVLTSVDSTLLRRAAGVVVLVSAAFLTFARGIKLPAGRPLALGAGLTSGLLQGSVGLGGPPLVIYFLAVGAEAQVSRASFVTYFAGLVLLTLPFHAWNGLITWEVFIWSLAMAPALVIGGYAGETLFKHGGHKHFRIIALGILVASGLAAILR